MFCFYIHMQTFQVSDDDHSLLEEDMVATAISKSLKK